jgi:hypothetical protein
MVKVISIATDSHSKMIDDLSDELLKYTSYELKVKHLSDENDGSFGTIGFFNSCYAKIQYIIDSLSESSDIDYLIYLDSDISVRGDIVSEMISELNRSCCDILFQQDSPGTFCAGMFVCNNNNKILDFFKTIEYNLQNNIEYYKNKTSDQTAINELLPTSDLKYNTLSLKFTTYGNIAPNIGDQVLWSPNSPKFEISNDVLAFHANFTIGRENKLELLKYVRSL